MAPERNKQGSMLSETIGDILRLFYRLFGPLGHLLLPMMKLFRCVRSYEVEPVVMSMRLGYVSQVQEVNFQKADGKLEGSGSQVWVDFRPSNHEVVNART